MIDVSKLDWSRCTYPPFDHQVEGVHSLIKNRVFGLLDEMGAGKTKQAIDTACFLYEAKDINTVLIICPAQVKDVWCHPQYSQIIEHAWMPGIIHEFTSRSRTLPSLDKGMTWIVVSVELLRNMTHVQFLITLLKNRKVWTIVDESSTISNFKASQTKGVLLIGRKASYRRTILNGTPVGNTPMGLYSQFEFLDPMILGFRSFYAFRNRHAKMGGYMGKQIIGFEGLEDVQKKIKPFVLRRLKKDCLDILPKMKSPLIEVKLSASTWKIYSQMREEFVAYLNSSSDEVSVVSTAPVKSLRLAQICSGFLGGFEDLENDEINHKGPYVAEIGCELTNAFLDKLEYRLSLDPDYRLIVWCRFRPEIARLEKMMKERFPQMMVKVLQGGQNKTVRDEAKSMFHPDSPKIEGPATLIGQPQAGRFGSNFTKCSNVDYLSNDHSLLTRLQSEDRVHRPGQKFQVLLQDYVVVGPNRERTVSGLILKALRNHEEIANWTCSKWVNEIMQEDPDVPF